MLFLAQYFLKGIIVNNYQITTNEKDFLRLLCFFLPLASDDLSRGPLERATISSFPILLIIKIRLGRVVPEFSWIGPRVFVCGNIVVHCFVIGPRLPGVGTSILVVEWRRKENIRKILAKSAFFWLRLWWQTDLPLSGVWILMMYPTWPQLLLWGGGGKRVV